MALTQATSKTVTFTLVSQPFADPYQGLSQTELDALIIKTLNNTFRQMGVAVTAGVTSA